MEKKANNQIGMAIIVMALLLLFGGIFLEDSTNTNNSNSNNYDNNNLNKSSFLFLLESIDIGKQKKVTQSYPNILLGSKEEFNTIFLGNDFRINANPFTTIPFSFDVDLSNNDNVNYLLLYFNLKRISGGQDLIILVNGKEISKNQANSANIPIKIYNTFNSTNNSTKMRITFLIDKPKWYSIFNWNKFDIVELKVVEVLRDKENNKRSFDFLINKDFLERVYLDLVISCDEVKEISKPIEVVINNYILSNANPKCTSKYNKITTDIPIEILSNKKNRMTFKTNGFYKIAYSINKIYFNDEQTYKFNINNFNNFNDVVMYGDFNKEVIDVRLNSNNMSLTRNEYKSVLEYLRLGVNEITFLEKPLEIKKFTIEESIFRD